MSDQRVTPVKGISGFPEWLPEARLIEAAWTDRIRATFERYGFTPIETPAVEAVSRRRPARGQGHDLGRSG